MCTMPLVGVEVTLAGVDVSQRSGRSVNSDINMIPFIDLLMVTIAFLLITAVWVSHSRIESTAQLPGSSSDEITIVNVEPTLHVYAHDSEFVLTWKQAATTISETHVPRVVPSDGGPVDHHELAAKITEEFNRHGSHREAADGKQDRAVVHSDDRLPFRELVAVMDAIHATKRDRSNSRGETARISAFGIGFAAR